jgi:hypothetical protein
MTDTDPAAARARGQAMRETRLARARALRRRIVAGAVALFVASWLLITIVLVSGHDPALAKNSAASTTASTASSGTSSTSSSGNVSSVTTRQS